MSSTDLEGTVKRDFGFFSNPISILATSVLQTVIRFVLSYESIDTFEIDTFVRGRILYGLRLHYVYTYCTCNQIHTLYVYCRATATVRVQYPSDKESLRKVNLSDSLVQGRNSVPFRAKN